MARQQFKKKGRRKVVTVQQPMLFDATNYKLMASGAALILLGFLIMYLESEVRGFWSLYVSPVVVLTGFGVVAYSIMKKRTDLSGDTDDPLSSSSSTSTSTSASTSASFSSSSSTTPTPPTSDTASTSKTTTRR